MDQFVAVLGKGVRYRIVGGVVHVSTAAWLDKPRAVMLPPRGSDAAANARTEELLGTTI
jgi:hypothetical protein